MPTTGSVALNGRKPTSEEIRWVEVLESIPRYKRALIWSLVETLEDTDCEDIREEIAQSIWACAFQTADDIRVENVKDLIFESDSSMVLHAHREHVAKNVYKFRKKRKWSQDVLAKKSGLPQSHISRIEGAKHCSTEKTIRMLANAFGVEMYDIDYSFRV